MPYKVKGKCVYKKDTGEKVGCTTGSVKKYLGALHANANEGTAETLGMTNEKTEKIKEIIRKMIKEVITEGEEEKLRYSGDNYDREEERERQQRRWAPRKNKITNPKTGETLLPPSDIPNQLGFKLIAVYKDGTELKTIVQKRADGTHHLTGVTDWSKMLGWKKLV